ncbi:Ras-related protein Rab11D [Tritrichomonas foetus]|uniref:Ras-related protein Rab11D n=1 Tax=Tritrichomonas foetus TaxID=1144522 RepID=A0A1J4L118_9EUKA|nr:Ras-related protein Rab11D [Tritrichomonas foetus]|eukprot:OHT15573.1 Ras-related protein Rab11D [Tritrichomonas foetus]
MTTTANNTYKIVVVGATCVGKTAIVGRLVDKVFNQEIETTIGVEFRTYPVLIGDKEVKLNIWDTAGQEKFKSVSKAYFRNAVGAVLVFSLTDRKSFEALDDWLNDLQSLCIPNAVILLVGNKVDLKDDRVISNEEANMFASRHNLDYYETSALEATNIEDSFVRLASSINEKVTNGEIQGAFQAAAPPVVLNAAPAPQQHQGGCGC